jgi:flavin reductase (DIM6/NTAB) family NADH-FMN oxidoreductase RutF
MTPIGSALAKIPSGIFILTAQHGADRTGMLASWVMQAGFEPPMVTVAVRKGRYIADWMRDQAKVAICILSDDEKNMISHFGRGFEPGQEAFRDVELLGTEREVPVLKDALAYLCGTVSGEIETGDHIIFTVRITSGNLMREGAPMTHIRKDGLKY